MLGSLGSFVLEGSPEKGDGIIETTTEVGEISLNTAAGGNTTSRREKGVVPVTETTVQAVSSEAVMAKQGIGPTLESIGVCDLEGGPE